MTWRKSSRSSNQGGQCVEARALPAWRKSSRSGSQGGQCVEARTLSGGYQVRDSKLGNASPILGVDRAEFTALLTDLKSGRLDG